MKIFLDTANVDEIKHILKWGIIDGVTTNQKIFLNEKGVDFFKRAKEICELLGDLPVSLESNSSKLEEILEDAKKFLSISKNVVIKIPMTPDGFGLEALSILSKQGIKTNATVMMNFNQLMLAAKAGATYVSIFYNRSKDAGEDADLIIKNFVDWVKINNYDTELIVGSIRTPDDVSTTTALGAQVITIPYKIMLQLPFHQKTVDTIKEFDESWKEFLSKN